MKVRITTLVENSLGENLALQNEHGLSFFIETSDLSRTSKCTRLLFDTGQSNRFIYNAGLLNIDLSKTEKIILSHGHYDHSGGLRDFVQTFGPTFELTVGTGFFTPKYAYNNGTWQYLGNNFDCRYLEKKSIGATFLSADTTEIAPGIYVVTNFPRTCPFEKPNQRYFTYNGRSYEQDSFTDELIIVLEVTAGLVVLLGCSHPGLINILETVRARFSKPIHCLIGGTHLVEADEVRLEQTLDFLRGLNLSMLGISHCTGERATLRLKEGQKNFFVNSTGTSLYFD
ncbi:MAG TPA: MBL fold metallo-hydrolase [Firmicutes bacterium]|nr:MBL fold metallo-hydrolase [Bacillota bacterium]